MSTFDQRFAIAKLIGYAEGIVNSGTLDPTVEWQLRIRIADALTAFNMPSKSETETYCVEMAQ